MTDQEEFLTRCVVDTTSRRFLLYSSTGETKVVDCETVDQFMDVLMLCRDLLDKDTLVYADPTISNADMVGVTSGPSSLQSPVRSRLSALKTMKLALAALLLFSALPADAKPSRLERIQRVNSRSGWSQEEQCIKTVYREEYVPGTMKSPGYITTFKEKVAVPCEGRNVASPISSGDEISHYPGTRRRYYHDGSYSTYYPTRYERPAPVDNNSCIEGTIAGGLLGGGAAGAMSRDKDVGGQSPLVL